METKTRFILEEGSFYQETIQTREIILNNDIITRFAQEQVIKVPAMFSSIQVGEGLVSTIGMSCKGRVMAFSLRMSEMPVRAKFTIKGGFLVPDFTGDEASSTFHMRWAVPSNLRLYLMVTMQVGKLVAGDQFLVAVDDQGRMYRLPTTNVYSDCRLCSGRFESSGLTCLDVLIKCWNQFQNSEWQQDLANHGGDNGMLYSQQFFRFKPLEGDAFEQQPIPDDWQMLCVKVGNETVTSMIIP